MKQHEMMAGSVKFGTDLFSVAPKSKARNGVELRGAGSLLSAAAGSVWVGWSSPSLGKCKQALGKR